MLEDINNYLQHSERLASSGQPSEAQLMEIAQAGFQVVINLAMTDTDYALKNEASFVKSLGLGYVHIPVIWTQPAQEDLESFYAVMDVHQDKRVFVHCAANMRATAFIALYQIQRQGWQPSHAFDVMNRIWKPNEQWAGFIQEVLSGSLADEM
jgi:protein tyrosine phosphatase (PTP) superfamily phosphohydrolase (DUF442 family)